MRSVLVVAFIFVTGFWSTAKSAEPNEDDFIPVAAFTATTVCQSLPTVFTNNSTTLSGSIVASIWDFGDGQGSSVFSPRHVFTSSGTFSVTLTVINTQGDVDDFTSLVTVYPSGVLNFLISSPNQCVSSTFNFTNLSNIVSGSFISYAWDFGDGANAATQNTSHHYNSYGTYTVTLTVTTNNNCNNTFSKVLEVYPEAIVDFNALNVCKGKEMPFTNTTSVGSGLIIYAWDFGDASASSEINPKHSYAASGDFQVSLKATTEKGCVTTATKQVTTHPVPVMNFTVADHCFGTNAAFTNQSTITNGTLSYNWNFGDGNSSAVETPSHLYSTTGNFEITLNATSNAGCENVLKKVLYVSPKAVVDFSFANVCLGELAAFANNTVTQGEVKYVWSFGDGTTSPSVNPQHSYVAYGQYDVKLIASNPQGGCPSELVKQINVNQQPVAMFEATDDCLGNQIDFVNTSVYQGTDISYNWQFGDGKSSTDMAPSHLYTSSQTYQATLMATALNGCSNSYVKQVRIAPLPLVNFMVDNVCGTRNAEFRNFTSISSGTINYVWDFGDASSSTDSDPVHLFTTHGDYKVKATATSDFGCTGVKEKVIAVYPMAIAAFNAPPVCDGFPVLYQNKSTVAAGDITAYRWDFGDETNSIVRNPSKEYIKAATYVVKLAVTTDRGCETSIEKSVTVYPPVVASFNVKDVCSTEAIRITNNSSVANGTLAYQWDFGDKTTSVATSPTHQFKDYGVYNIKLIASSNTGCKDSVYHAVAIFNSPEVSAGEDQSVSQGYPVQLNALGGVEYSWEPIEGLDNSTIASPVATPLVTTEYVVTVKDQYGCENTDTVTVTVDTDYKLMATNVLTPDGNGKNDTWVIENVETFGDVHVSVYDRWGKQVYKQNAYQNDWTGMAGGDALPDGTYYYFISFDSSDKMYKGAITLIRNKK